jgi:hypothetical protein
MKCLTCKHCNIDFGTPAWSDITPGESGEWMCYKGVWDIPQRGDGKTKVYNAFQLGETCKLWEPDGNGVKP